jgi:hypothetical protein
MHKFLIYFIVFLAFEACKNPEKKRKISTSEFVSKNQILLTNNAKFKGYENGMTGASAFLVKYNNRTIAVTARHLLAAIILLPWSSFWFGAGDVSALHSRICSC